jgi:anionic cell wall polymer biosynthesis LytR-Cps2A-Psr (LCP) family protein
MGKILKKIVLFLFLVIILTAGISFYFWQKIPVCPLNFLILGIAGENHQGKDLTDTIMFASLNPYQKQLALVSLPRDIWLEKWRAKLNSIYHYKGLPETKKTVEEILGQKTDYGIIIDFEVFQKIIDTLGGITVDIERSFDDYKYPIPGKENDLCNGDPLYRCRYEHLHFEAGRQFMDGQTALKFVRSRNAQGEEGTDFARTARQQKVILAIKDKILSKEFLLSPKKAIQLFKLITLNIQTDIPKEKYWQLLKVGLKIRNIKTITVNSNYLTNPPISKKYDNQWVLVPKSGNWSEIQEYVKKFLISND